MERLSDTTLHDWYRHVYAYSDQLIFDLVDEWEVSQDDLICDPFVGTGTSLVAANQLGIDAIGTDVMPPSVLSTQVKTNWSIDPDEFKQRYINLLDTVEPVFTEIGSAGNVTLTSFSDDGSPDIDLDAYDFSEPEMLMDGWLSQKPLRKMLALKQEINELPADDITDILRVAMFAILPEEVANVGFGPEVYRTAEKEDVDVYGAFRSKLAKIERDLRKVNEWVEETPRVGRAEAFEADARIVGDVLRQQSSLFDEHGEVDYVITSPPYPAEHDYTRNQRLELVWTDAVTDRDDLRRIKENSIRSNTKNIYVGDDDGERTDVRDNEKVDSIVTEMERILEEEDITHGFGKYYPRVVEEYFGGMIRHLEQVYDLLAADGRAAYVVADQASYWQVEIPTATILAELAEEKVGFESTEIRLWRNVVATTGRGKELDEEILILSPRD